MTPVATQRTRPGMRERLDFLDQLPIAAGSRSSLQGINPLAASAVPEDVCRVFRVLPISYWEGLVTVAIADPADELALRVVDQSLRRNGLHARIRMRIVEAGELERATNAVFGVPRGIEELIERARRAPRVFEVEESFEPEPYVDAGTRATALADAAIAEPPVEAEPIAPPAELAPQVEPPVVAPRRLGERLIDAGVLTPHQLDQALALQQRYGGPLGELLAHMEMVDEEAVTIELAAQFDMPYSSLAGVEPDPHAVARLPEEMIKRFRVLPLSAAEGVLELAVAEPLDDDAFAEIREHVMLALRTVLASYTAIDRLTQRAFAEPHLQSSVSQLLEDRPEESAHRVLSRGQRIVLTVAALVLVAGLIVDPILTIIVFNTGSVLFYTAFSISRLRMIVRALNHDLEIPVTAEELARIDERTLPVFTLLVPLYQEAVVLPRLLESLRALDYPPTKLDIKLLVEEDDPETIAAIEALRLPPQFRLVVVPDAQPRTKPKACNYGLLHARGDFVVIYDAEDQPESDQLKKIILAFEKAGEHVACIQCKLNYYNRNQNILTEWFTTEYSMWFDLFMPGLAATGAPIPLGGTSNHFRTYVLRELGAWDPFNVTEDADLGIRLAKLGMTTGIVDSTTFEEANSDVGNWIRQRSRWVKGYIQTWLVHMRHPLRLLRQLGPKRWLSFQFVIGGTFVGFLLNPIYWALTSLWLLTEAGVIRDAFPSFIYYIGATGLFVGNFVFTYANVAGSLYRDYHDLVKFALFSPVYWALMSIAAWRGLLQLVSRPHYWEKTVHGLDLR